jgi:hypothetical protein
MCTTPNRSTRNAKGIRLLGGQNDADERNKENWTNGTRV